MIDIAGIGGQIIVWVIYIMMGIVGVGAIAFMFIRIQNIRKFAQFKCIIFEKNGFGQLDIHFDDAGIFLNKDTNTKMCFMRRHKVGLCPDNIPFIPFGNAKYIFLLRIGTKNFRFLKPTFGDSLSFGFDCGEVDVNWAINDYAAAKKRFSQSALEKYAPYIALIVVSMIIFMMVYFTLKTIPDSLNKALPQLTEISRNLAAARSGTTIVQP